jgi:hypothetical protein
MSGAFSSVKGSTGPAPTTVWFGTVPDKYNMLLPNYYFDNGSTTGEIITTGLNGCDFINQWIPWDTSWSKGTVPSNGPSCSIGSTTTAPDGTSTAYHVTEAANAGNSNYHILLAGCTDSGLRQPCIKRLAVFAKAAERTRCLLQVGEFVGILPGFNNQDFGVRCIFDLAGGRIGVPITTYGTGAFGGAASWGAIGSGIIPYGNGWYVCYIDVAPDTNSPTFNSSFVLQSCFGPDAGSGTGAANFQYVGNGTSGVYAWRTNMLPPRAYGINNVSFFDDFLNFNDVDVNNTQAPGFNWYVGGGNVWPKASGTFWAAGVWDTPIAPGKMSIITYGGSSSVLKIPGSSFASPQANLVTATYAGTPGKWYGNGFAPPCLIEWRGAWDYQVSGFGAELAFWTVPLEYLSDPTAVVVQQGGPFFPTYHEIDFVDSGSSGAELTPITGHFDGDLGLVDEVPYNNGIGIAWQSTLSYSTGNIIGYAPNGLFYRALGTTTPGATPPTTPGEWALNPVTNPDDAHRKIVDFGQLHTYSMLIIPDNSKNGPHPDCGTAITFLDGICCGAARISPPGEMLYGSAVQAQPGSASSILQRYDASHMMFILGAARNRAIYTDYIRVTQ